MELILILGVMVVLLIFSSRQAKKKQAAARQSLEEQLVPGAWVQTIGGFCAKLVEIDGDVVVLATLSGEESLWLRSAIARVEAPPFATVEEEEVESADETTETEPEVAETVVETVEEVEVNQQQPTEEDKK